MKRVEIWGTSIAIFAVFPLAPDTCVSCECARASVQLDGRIPAPSITISK